MNLHTHQLYLLEQHSESFKIWPAIIRINTEGKYLIMKLGPELHWVIVEHLHMCKKSPNFWINHRINSCKH